MKMRTFVRSSSRFAVAIPLATLLHGLPPASATPIVALDTAGNYAILAGTTVTNAGLSVVNGGNVGVAPETAITGFSGAGTGGPGILDAPYSFQAGTGLAGAAQTDLTNAYDQLAELGGLTSDDACTPGATDLTGKDLGGMVLSPGVYCFTSGAQLTGTLTLNVGSDPTDAEFVFQMGSTLVTATDSKVVETDNSLPVSTDDDDNIFWQVGSSATLGTDTVFLGDIVALTSISLDVGAQIDCGAALARNGEVSLLDNGIVAGPACGGTVTSAPNPVPEPSTLLGLGTALFGLVGVGWKRRWTGRTVSAGASVTVIDAGPIPPRY